MTPRFLIVHHSLTDDGSTVSWGAIRSWHKGEAPASPYQMRDIGYHYGIERVGSHQEILLGRLAHETGAHCKELGMNRQSLGICLVGNFDVAPPPDAQLAQARRLIRHLMDVHQIPRPNVLGHREVGMMAGFDWEKGLYKSCPGKLFPMESFRFSL